MPYFIDDLKLKIILSDQNIAVLRRFIDKKNPTQDSSSKAKILAQAIHQIIDQHLRGLEESQQFQLKNELFKKIIEENASTITLYHVLDHQLSLIENNKSFLDTTTRWINRHLDQPIGEDDLRKYYLSAYSSTLNYGETLSIKKEKPYIKEEPLYDNEEPPYISEKTPCLKKDIDLVHGLPKNTPSSGDNDTEEEEMKQIKKRLTTTYFNTKKIAIAAMTFFLIIFVLSTFRLPETKSSNEAQSPEGNHSSSNILFTDQTPSLDGVTSGGLQSASTENKSAHQLTIPPFSLSSRKDLPTYFKYQPVNKDGLKEYLISRDSILADEPYFSTIIYTSRDFDLNPLLLFAIAGHEQGFVPRTHPEAHTIANNPFNVFNSWQNYNTDIKDATEIACRTVIRLSKDRPIFINPFIWLNSSYAEDPNWWRGVQSLFNRLLEESL